MRKIILHNHLFKNAGTTLDWSLERNFKEQFLDHREDRQMVHEKDHLLNLLGENKNLKAVSSHNLCFPLPDEHFNFFTLQLLRHPLERVSSVYLFEKQQLSSSTPGALFARNNSLNDYVMWRMREDVGCTIRNFQTRKLGVPHKIINNDKLLEEHFKIAQQYILKNPLVGIVENYDETMVIFENHLQNEGLEVDLSYIRQNSGKINHFTFDQKIDFLKSELDPNTFEELTEKNAYDLKIYESVKSRQTRLVEENSYFSQLLLDFKNRCKAILNNTTTN